MGRDNREIWRERVERWRRSGLTAKAFAKEGGVHAGTLQHWRWQLRAERRGWRPATKGRPRFVEVAAPVGSAPITREAFELELPSGNRLRIPPGFDGDALKRLVEILERR